MSEPSERVVKGQQVTVEGIPVTIEMDRGVLVIHVGNLPDDGPPERYVRLTAATAKGAAGLADQKTARRLERGLTHPAVSMPVARRRLRDDCWEESQQTEKT